MAVDYYGDFLCAGGFSKHLDTSYYCDMEESVEDLYQSNLPGSTLVLQSDKGERMRPSLSHTLCS